MKASVLLLVWQRTTTNLTYITDGIPTAEIGQTTVRFPSPYHRFLNGFCCNYELQEACDRCLQSNLRQKGEICKGYGLFLGIETKFIT